jgi:hypothetical protein
MTSIRSISYTTFFLVYGSEAVMPSDIVHDSAQVAAYVEQDNDLARQNGLDFLEEARDLANSRSSIYL